MILYVNENGDVRSVPSYITQGSFVREVSVVAPFVNAMCILRLKPPSEEWLEDIVMAPAFTADGKGAVFTGPIPGAVTTVAGRLLYQIEFVGDDGKSLSSERGSINILPGVISDMPDSVGDLSQYSLKQIYALLSRISGNVIGLKKSVGDMMTSVPVSVVIPVTAWEGKRSAVEIPQVREDSIVNVSYVPNDAEEYADAGIMCVEQHEGSLVFACEELPRKDIGVYVLVMDDIKANESSDVLPYVEDGILVIGNATLSVVDGILVLS